MTHHASPIRHRIYWSLCAAFVCALLTFGATRDANADPSLDPDDYFEVKTNIREKKGQPITLLRDHEKPLRFYYIPSAPQVSRVTDQRGNVPEFTLLRYQFEENGVADEGGVLQFTVELALPDPSIEMLQKNLAAKLANLGTDVEWQQIDIAPIPLRDSKVHFYSPDNGAFVASGERTGGVAPTYVTQKMPYSLTLTRKGTAVFDQLIKGPTGLGVAFEVVHTGLSPEAGFYVEVDWQKVHDLVSSESNESEYESWNRVFWTESDEKNSSVKDITNSLTNSGAIVAKAYGDDSIIPTEDLLKYMDKVLQRVHEEVYGDDASVVPEKLDPATAAPADAKAEERSKAKVVNSANLTAKIEQNRTERYEFNVRETQTVKTVFGNFVGIGGWLASKNWLDGKRRSGLTEEGDEKLREWGLLAYASDRSFESAYLSLPPVYPDKDWNLSQVRLEMQLLDENGSPIAIGSQTTRSAEWNAAGKNATSGTWTDMSKKPKNCFLIPLGDVGFNRNSLAGLSFRNTVKLRTFSGKTMSYIRHIDCESGDLDLGNPFEPIEILTIEPRALKFESTSDRVKSRLGGELVQIEVYLREPHSGRSKRVVLEKGNDHPFSFLMAPVGPHLRAPDGSLALNPDSGNVRCGYSITCLIENDDFDEVPCKPLTGFVDRREAEESGRLFRPVVELSMKHVLQQIEAAKEDATAE